MKKKLTVFWVVVFALVGLGFEPGEVVKEDCQKPQTIKADCSIFSTTSRAKNVILFIGDGMGLNQIYSARVFKNGPSQPLELEKFPHQSLIKTCSLSGVTDSAGAGTALATGNKTQNTKIGVDQNNQPLTNLIELAKKQGKAVGLLTTDQLVGATPSDFALHQSSRFSYQKLAEDYLSAELDLLLGGGKKWFIKKKDSRDLIKEFSQAGYQVVFNLEALEKVKAGKVFGLFSDEEMTYELNREPDSEEPHLYQMTEKAIELLSQDPDGFFLMVEGARIDHACHKTDFNLMLFEVLALEEAVKGAKQWQEKNPDTLILVTADHETGGLKVKAKDYQKGDKVEHIFKRYIPGIIALHSSQRVALFAQGPGAELAQKAEDNTEVFCIISQVLGLEISQKEKSGCGCGQ